MTGWSAAFNHIIPIGGENAFCFSRTDNDMKGCAGARVSGRV